MTFVISDLPENKIKAMIDAKVWQSDCPVKLEHLKLLKLTHLDFQGNLQHGELVVHQIIAENTIAIFKALLDKKFPIEQIKTIDLYQGNDDESMKANNSSCFNYRKIKGSDRFSIHSYGLAIDINPVQNPCISFLDNQNELIDSANKDQLLNYRQKLIDPTAGKNYLDRTNQRPGMVEPIVDIFKNNGFAIWGGEWKNPLDYHHFQVSRDIIDSL